MPSSTEEAPESLLPELLVDPPWARSPIVLANPEHPDGPTVVDERTFNRRSPVNLLPEDTDWQAVADRLLSGRALDELQPPRRRSLWYGLLFQGPDDLARKALADGRYWDLVKVEEIESLTTRYGLDAYPLAVHVAGRCDDVRERAEALQPFVDADVALTMLQAGSGIADRWFRRHGRTTISYVLPYALGEHGPLRDAAWRGLRLTGRHGHDAVRQAAQRYGDEAVRYLERLKAPAALPDLEPFDPARLPRILLRDGRHALPGSAVLHVITMLHFSTFEEPFPGLDSVIDVCDPDSLAEFAWQLYRTAPRPRRSRYRDCWAHEGVRYALGRLGNGETAGRLAAEALTWPWPWTHNAEAYKAVWVFPAIGTDQALRELLHLSQKAKDHKRMREHARKALEAAASDRGVAVDGLRDLLVPWHGLDAEGGMTLDYGPRTFRVGFDASLAPYVIDETGKYRKSLPKPGVQDDAARADDARARFTVLKKEAKKVAATQIERLEEAMVTARQWTAGDFRAVFYDHPLLRHIACRLVWSVDGRTFRIAEDRTFADADDNTVDLPPDARVALPHPVNLGDELDAWSRTFADYEILQPFPQLGRAFHTLTEQERAVDRLHRFEGAKTPNGSLLRLFEQEGWSFPRDDMSSIRGRRSISRPFPGGRVELGLQPGVPTRNAPPEDPQEITTVRLVMPGDRVFGDVEPSIVSEVIAELIDLTGS